MSMVTQPAKKSTTDRALRAWQEAGNYELIAALDAPDAWTVIGPRSIYTTTANTCDCPDATRRPGTVCKHSHLVRLHEQQMSEAPKPAAAAPSPEERRAARKAQMSRDFPD